MCARVGNEDCPSLFYGDITERLSVLVSALGDATHV